LKLGRRSARSYSVAGEQLTLRSAGGMAPLTYKAHSEGVEERGLEAEV
jgi:hypothetical protein